MTTEATEVRPLGPWAKAELDVLSDPKMMEISDAAEFMAEFHKRAGTSRTIGAVAGKLKSMHQFGMDVNLALYESFQKLEYVGEKAAHAAGLTKKSRERQRRREEKEKEKAKLSKTKPTSAMAVPADRTWVSQKTLAVLMGVDTARVSQLSTEKTIGFREGEPENGKKPRLYSVLDAIEFIENRGRPQTKTISADQARDLLDVESDSKLMATFGIFPDADGACPRAEVLRVWMNSGLVTHGKKNQKDPAKKKPASRVSLRVASHGARGVTKAKNRNGRVVGSKPSLSLVTPSQAVADSAAQEQASDFEWMLHGVRRGLIDANEVADMVVKLAKKN